MKTVKLLLILLLCLQSTIAQDIFPDESKWIWPADMDRGPNTRVNFRKSLQLEQNVDNISQAWLYITADSRYRLWANGTWLGDGPARSYPQKYYVDKYDMKESLINGDNNLSVSVLSYGVGNFQYIPSTPGLICYMEITYYNGDKQLVYSDKNWKWDTWKAYQRLSPRISIQMGYEEQYDARKYAPDWFRAQFDDSAWKSQPQTRPASEVFRLRPVPMLTRELVRPIEMMEENLARPANITETVSLRYNLLEGRTDHVFYQFYGAVATLIISQGDQEATLRRAFSAYTGPWYLNGEEISHPGRDDVDIMLQDGANLLVADMNGGSHHPEVSISLVADKPVFISAPFNNEFKWLAIDLDEYASKTGRHERDDSEDLTKLHAMAKEMSTMDGLEKYKKHFEYAHWDNAEIPLDVWNTCFAQQAVEIQGRKYAKGANGFVEADDPSPMLILPTEGHDIELLFDFGRELVGYTRLVLDAPEGVHIDVHGFEAYANDKRQETYSHRNSFRYTTREGKQSYTTWNRRGYRYLSLTIRGLERPMKIHELSTLLSTYPVDNSLGSFECSDPLLNRIWETGAYTLRCCMEDTYTDCPAYEQVYWVGDGYIESLVALYSFGAYDLTSHCLKMPAEGLYRSPMAESHVPSAWQNIIPAWTFLWVQMARDYYHYTADTATIRELFPAIDQSLQHCMQLTDNARGLFSIYAWNFFDWAPVDRRHDLVTTNQALLIGSLADAREMALGLGKEDVAEEYGQYRATLIQNMNKHLWSADKQAYIDAIHDDGTPSTVISQQVQTLASLYHIPGPQQEGFDAYTYMTAPPEGMVRFGSPFAMFFLLEGFAAMDDYASLYQIIREKWGYMLEQGATTFWETFPNEERTDWPTRSYCHAWSAGPVFFLSRYALGIYPAAPGYASVGWAPKPEKLTWAKGTVPLIDGSIEAAWEIKNGQLLMQATAIKARPWKISLPITYKGKKATLSVNGKETEINASVIDKNIVFEIDSTSSLKLNINIE